MSVEKNWVYKDEFLLDWQLYQEVNLCFFHVSARCLIRRFVILLIYAAVLGAMFQAPHLAQGVLFGSTVGIVIDLVRKRLTKDGNRHYKKQLENNGGKPPYKIHTYYDDELISIDQDSKTQTRFSYSQIQKIIETNRVMVLITDTKECVVIDTRWLSGGSREEFRSFLTSRCSNMRRGIQKDSFSRVLQVIIKVVSVAAVILSLLFAYFENHPISPGSLPDDLTYREIAAELSGLGITCSEETIQELEQMAETYISLEYHDYYGAPTVQSRTIDLLSWAGYGSYDMETLEWTPSSNGVFWVDMEAFRVDTMYTDYLRGIEALSGGELQFTNVQETYDTVDWEKGIGFGTLIFSLNGKSYSVALQMDADWYSLKVLKRIGSIINSQNTGKQLYYLSDSGQGILIFYSDAHWAKEFTQLTGFPLSKRISSASYLTAY